MAVHVLPVTQAGLVIPAILAIPVVLVILVMSVVLVILLVLVVQVVLVVFGDPIEQSHSIHPFLVLRVGNYLSFFKRLKT